MASQAGPMEFTAGQVAAAGAVLVRKMFGEYAVSCDGRLTALMCDDQLFIKPTAAGRAPIGEVYEAPPHKGAKPCFLVSGDPWDDRDWLATLIRVSAGELPLPNKSRRKGSAFQHGNR